MKARLLLLLLLLGLLSWTSSDAELCSSESGLVMWKKLCQQPAVVQRRLDEKADEEDGITSARPEIQHHVVKDKRDGGSSRVRRLSFSDSWRYHV